jgi:hypothetical protein
MLSQRHNVPVMQNKSTSTSTTAMSGFYGGAVWNTCDMPNLNACVFKTCRSDATSWEHPEPCQGPRLLARETSGWIGNVLNQLNSQWWHPQVDERVSQHFTSAM